MPVLHSRALASSDLINLSFDISGVILAFLSVLIAGVTYRLHRNSHKQKDMEPSFEFRFVFGRRRQ